ncbi:MAG TPA: hypothetical protein VNO14_15855, partial [Blastocatellia bacterium]|nr:hypothetical protein [Blastocatellia bacterium]
RGMGKDCTAFITDMNQPLGRAVGNAVEAIEAFEALKGQGPDDLVTLCRELASEMIVMGRAAPDLDQARSLYDDLIRSGAALEKMREIIAAQGGNPRAVDDYDLMPRARMERKVLAARAGYVQQIDTQEVGRASMLLGAGRLRLETAIDLGVGLRVEAKIGDRVDSGSTLVTLFFNDEARAEEAARVVERAYTIGPERAAPPELIKSILR